MPICVLSWTPLESAIIQSANRKLKRSCRAPAGDSSTREEFTCRPPEKNSPAGKWRGAARWSCTDRSHTRITLRVWSSVAALFTSRIKFKTCADKLLWRSLCQTLRFKRDIRIFYSKYSFTALSHFFSKISVLLVSYGLYDETESVFCLTADSAAAHLQIVGHLSAQVHSWLYEMRVQWTLSTWRERRQLNKTHLIEIKFNPLFESRCASCPAISTADKPKETTISSCVRIRKSRILNIHDRHHFRFQKAND